MLELKDFFHLPQVDSLLTQIAGDWSGLVLVAGLDSRPAGTSSSGFLPSGRSTIFGVLARGMLAQVNAAPSVLIAAKKDALRVPNSLARQLEFLQVRSPFTYADQIAGAVRERPGMLIIDVLNSETAPLALEAARSGIRVLSQLDCVFCGSGVARHLVDLGVPRQDLDGLNWVITVRRLATLCPHCKQPALLSPERLADLERRFPDLPSDRTFFRAIGGCSRCHQTGKSGDMVAFDIFHAMDSPDLFEQASILSMEAYAVNLAALGHVSIDEITGMEADALHHTYSLLTESERALTAANAELTRKLATLESAHRVLQKRTESLVSLQEIAHTLIMSTDLDDLADRVARYTHKLCGADRSILYVLRPDGTAEVLAVSGWNKDLVHRRLDAEEVLNAIASVSSAEPTPFSAWPPGIPPRHPDIEGAELRAGLSVPLVAQHEAVGLMIVHSTRKLRFAASEIALLQAFANQAAIAIQRTGLIESLREKIDQLQTAQAELVRKERLERELELARQVQQNLLPRAFVQLPGYAFAAKSEAARRVGGDFYDAFQIDEGHYGIVIADVSDKGMPAALFMALTRSLLLAEARRELSPRQVLANINRLLLELGEPDMFVTVFYGVLDTAARTLTYSRAGHEQPLLLRTGTVRALKGKGSFLGFWDQPALSLSEEQCTLQSGDRLVLYTDGLVDALNPVEEAFGAERFVDLLRRNAHRPPEEICEAAFSVLADFQENTEQFDDMAMLVVGVE